MTAVRSPLTGARRRGLAGRAAGQPPRGLGPSLVRLAAAHPVYESAEIMSVETAAAPYRVVWVFFTERDGNKRKIHYLDNQLGRGHGCAADSMTTGLGMRIPCTG